MGWLVKPQPEGRTRRQASRWRILWPLEQDSRRKPLSTSDGRDEACRPEQRCYACQGIELPWNGGRGSSRRNYRASCTRPCCSSYDSSSDGGRFGQSEEPDIAWSRSPPTTSGCTDGPSGPVWRLLPLSRQSADPSCYPHKPRSLPLAYTSQSGGSCRQGHVVSEGVQIRCIDDTERLRCVARDVPQWRACAGVPVLH